MPMVYDEHYQSGEPGPVARYDWFDAISWNGWRKLFCPLRRLSWGSVTMDMTG